MLEGPTITLAHALSRATSAIYRHQNGAVIRRTERGFGLVETLVVIAIIAILAAIVTTAALGAKRQAKATSCLANLKQIETGIRLYENDFDDYWPPYPLLSSDADVPAFKRSLASYKLSEPLWYCPLDSKAKTNYPSEWGSHEHWSYELSLGFALQAHNIQTPKGPISRSGLADPAGTWMLSDQTEIVQPSTRLSAHGDRVNVMFADGHAKSMPVVKL